ncbi:MAG: phosphomannomutase/phosphoglucomutase [Planctomycetes bacterium]|nr:phosphomannomutase/phosphoglucomutase [Planctomycetota bacterium]NUQ34091.1 phosphomannomutase/phosphoglucomutase [Planctomycetaceae bacterium]
MGIFKAYDIRGVVPHELDEAGAFAIGYGFARFLQEETHTPEPLIVIGRDMRMSGEGLTRAMIGGANTAGARVVDAGLCTTPMLYAAVAFTPQASGGACVTASHNGPEYNGFKLCRAGAVPVSRDTGLLRIEDLSHQAPSFAPNSKVSSEAFPPRPGERAPVPPPDSRCSAALWDAYWRRMRLFKRTWPDKVKLAIDPANGMGCLYVPLLKALGAEIVSINDTLDGTFPAHEANPIKAENLEPCQHLVHKNRATLGVAFDGDADRVAFVNERGSGVPCDLLTAALARAMLARNKGAAVLYDLRSSRAVDEIIREAGGKPVRERVGHSFMKATMRAKDCVFGGELSGHYYYRDAFYADSALMTVIEVLNAMGESGKPLSELTANVRRYHQSGEVNFEVADKDRVIKRLREHYRDGAMDELDGLTVNYPSWWFNVRPSNTEPLLRLNVEATTAEELSCHLSELRALLEK